MSDDIQKLLRKYGPGLTPEFIKKLIATGLTDVAARKRIQRAHGGYRRLAGIQFEKNARFIYLPEQYEDELYWENLEKSFHKAGKSYWTAVTMMKAHGGIVPSYMFARICGAPTKRKKHLAPELILQRLCSIHMLHKHIADEQTYVSLNRDRYPQDTLSEVRAKEITEKIALNSIKEWARKLGLGSYNKFALRGEISAPSVSGIAWDLTAPSYIRPLTKMRDNKALPGFLVCDINLRERIRREEAEAFIWKCNMAAGPVNTRPIMPLFVGHVFTPDAFSLLKGKGVLALTFSNLFGEEAADALRDLFTMLTDLGRKISIDPSCLQTVMASLSKIQGAADNLLGTLFEFVVGALVKEVEGGYLTTGERLRDTESGQSVEVDVQLKHGSKKEVLVIECKAKNPNARVSAVDIKKWYGKIPLIYLILKKKSAYKGRSFRFELWSNGPFNSSGLEWLQGQKTKFDGYSIGWRDGQTMKAYAGKAKKAYLSEILNQHYFRSSLKKVVS